MPDTLAEQPYWLDALHDSRFLLVLSVLFLGVGPLCHRLVRGSGQLLSALDGFVLVAVGGVVVFQVLPHSIEEGGGLAVLLALVGLVGPYAIERLGTRGARGGHKILALFVLLGLLPHAALDGVALSSGAASVGRSVGLDLSLAVVLHRITDGFAVWWLLRPAGTPLKAGFGLGLMGLATVIGYYLGGSAIGELREGRGFALLEALVGGSLFHVLLHRPHLGSEHVRHPLFRLLESAGACVGLVLVLLLPAGQAHLLEEASAGSTVEAAADYWETFLSLALATAPALLLGYVTAGLLAVFVPHATLGWLRRGGSLHQALRGLVYGIPLPICSCGVVPIYRGLVLKGAPATAAMAFLIATPEIGVDSFFVSWPLLGAELTLIRLACAALVALSVGWFVGRSLEAAAVQSASDDPDRDGRGREPGLVRVVRALRTGLGEVVDETAPWILAGLAVAAALKPSGLERWIAELPGGTDVVFFALVGMPIYVCASGATPLAAVLIYKGVSPGAALAFLLTGPATNITTFGVLRALHGRGTALRFAAAVMVVAVALGYAVNLLFPTSGAAVRVAELDETASVLSWACLGILGLVFALSVLRLGPRNFTSSLFVPNMQEGHACEDGHDHP